ncbi:MAG: sucrose-6-phosphate hydrolase [Lachnospiraceae bacterium]|nr:sucrose-6-phosphate hydrolase [Lachnospiraceae bacterium]
MNQLEKARIYEQENGSRILEEQRPVFHVTPTVGWMNDPNGFSMYQGACHLFYQYYPYDVHWGPMYWGHVRTKDFMKWERLPVALAPEEDYESGCFSGSAIEMEDGKQLLLYTAHLEKKGTYAGEKTITETQCIALGDGVNYVKSSQNPVITKEMLPEGFSESDFRDPKIWKEEDGYYCVAVGRSDTCGGAILLFHSLNGLKWEFVSVLDKSEDRYGTMWECPDLFRLGDKTILLTSPMGMFAKELEFHNGHGVVYLAGTYDKENHSFQRNFIKSLEYGLDFYAPQTMETQDGRRIMIGWMQSWDNYMTPEGYTWSGMMTLPRELTWKNDRLCQQPVGEISKYYTDSVIHEHCIVNSDEKITLENVQGRIIDMTVTIHGGDYHNFTMWMAEDDRYYTTITYDREQGIVTFDRRYSGLTVDGLDTRSFHVEETHGGITFRVVMDRYSVEFFMNHGEQACTSLIYTPQEADGISFRADGCLDMTVKKHQIQIPDTK